MAIYTESYFKNLAATEQRTSQRSAENIILGDNKRIGSFDIFLSHSYLDKDIVAGITVELTRLGYSVYVDWIVDRDLSRENVSKETADKLRSRMRSCNSLFYATSTNSSSSKWMPWELGFMDGKKDKCSILPIAKENSPNNVFKGHEYLSVYPYVIKHKVEQREKLIIVEAPRKWVLFDNWLKGLKPTEQYQTV